MGREHDTESETEGYNECKLDHGPGAEMIDNMGGKESQRNNPGKNGLERHITEEYKDYTSEKGLEQLIPDAVTVNI